MKNKFIIRLLSYILIISMLVGSLFGCFEIVDPSESNTSTSTTIGGATSSTTTSTTTSATTSTTTSTTTSGSTTGTTSSTSTSSSTITPDPDDDCTDGHTDAQQYGKSGYGLCDVCGADVLETIDFYNFNDLHGKFLYDSYQQPGIGQVTSFLEDRKEKDDHVVITSSGDMWQGSGESYITRGAIITEWMNYLEFDAMAIGNHEYDWGEKFIRSNSDIAEFPFLAINIYDNATGQRADYCEPSVMIERGDVQIGIIGAIGDCYSSILFDMVKGVNFKTGFELTKLVKAESERLRKAGADVIVYLYHEGTNYSSTSSYSSYYDPTLSSGGYIDLVFEGHSHSYYTFTENGVPHVQGGGDNKYARISHIELEVNFANGHINYNVVENISNYNGYSESDIVEELKTTYSTELAEAFKVLGYNSKLRDDTVIESLVAQLYYEAGCEKWAGKYDIVLAGGDINTRSPYDLDAGNVTFADLLTILPFDNKLMLCSIKGSDLKSRFFNNSEYVYYSKLTSTQISNNATYYIVVDTWSSGYSKNNLTVIAEYDDKTFAHDLLAEYIEKGNWE